MAKNKGHLPALLFHAAKGFYDIGFNCACQIKKDNGLSSFQRLAPAAVNFSFAVELFLKGLINITIKKPVRGHHVKSLYLELPTDIQAKIEFRYQYHLIHNDAQKHLSAFAIVTEPAKKTQNRSQKLSKKITVLELLHSHNKAFENWRYFHEIEEGYDYEFNFQLMDCFLKAVIDVINTTPNKNQLSLQMI